MDTPEILAGKSRELLNEQLVSVDANNSKAGTIITISALFVPISFSVFDKFAINNFWIFVFSIPIIINLLGIFYLIVSMYPKKLQHGMHFNGIVKNIDTKPENIYLFEIGINKDSYNFNSDLLSKQNRNIRNGIKLIFVSVVSLTIIFFVNLLTIKNIKMNDTNNHQSTNSSSGNDANQGSDSGSSSDGGRQIPSTDPGQRATIEKGGEPSGIPLKQK